MSRAGRGARIVVIGGGVAGIAAALQCARAGAQVTLLEVRPRLGGAAYSFQREGIEIDNGQHVFMRCCGAYAQLLRELGSDHLVRLQHRLEVPVLAAGGQRAVIGRNRLPAPLHLAGTLARFDLLGLPARAAAAAAGLALWRVDERARSTDQRSFGDWLRSHGQGDAAIECFWDLMVLPALNVPSREASLALAAFVLKTIMFGEPGAGDIGFHEAPLARVIGEPALELLRREGVEVELSRRVLALAGDADALRVRIGPRASERLPADGADQSALDAGAGAAPLPPAGTRWGSGAQDGGGAGEQVRAESVIVALPHRRTAELLRRSLPQLSPAGRPLEALAGRLERLRSAPIVNLHAIFDRRVCEPPFFAAARSPLQYVFDRTAAGLGAGSDGQYLAISLSCAEREMAMSREQLREAFMPAIRELLPRADPRRLQHFFVTREHAATFRALPGSAALRPPCGTQLQSLQLAGAYTATGWPATLESAARSGLMAARIALDKVGLPMNPAHPYADEVAAAGPSPVPSATVS